MARIPITDWTTEDGLLKIKGWARDGLTDAQIANNIGIGYTTFKAWMRKEQSIRTALKEGKGPVDIEVENALYKMAVGHTVKIMKPIKLRTVREGKFKGQEGKGRIEEERVVQAEEEVYVAPNVTAAIFWLKNRRPERWRDKREYVDASGDNGGISADVRNAVEQAVRDYGSADPETGGKQGDDTNPDDSVSAEPPD